MTIGDRIKSIRIEKGLKQKDLASLAGIPTITLQQYERGVTKQPRIEIVKKIAEALNTPAAYLLGIDSSDSRKRMQFLMERYGLSFDKLSAITEIPIDMLQKYASDRATKISKENLELIAEALHTTTVYLLGFLDDPDFTFSSYYKNIFIRNLNGYLEKVNSECLQDSNQNPFKGIITGTEELTLETAFNIAINLNIPFTSMIKDEHDVVTGTMKNEDQAIDEHIDALMDIVSEQDDALLNSCELKIHLEEIKPRRIRIVTEYIKDSAATLRKLFGTLESSHNEKDD